MAIIARPLGTRGSGGGGGKATSVVWLTGVTGNGTFLSITNKTPLLDEATEIETVATDATTLNLTITGDRGLEFEPTVVVNGVPAIRSVGNTTSAATTGTFTWTASIPASGTITILTSDNYSTTINVIQESPATVSNLLITNNPSGDLYPTTQTEVKSGDPIYISFTTDLPIDRVYGLNTLSGSSQTVNVSAGVSHVSIQMTCGSTTTVAALKAISINTRTVSGAISSVPATSSNTILCNNIYPTVNYTATNYPAGQGALKGSEVATVNVTTANLDSLLYTSPNGQLSITGTTVDESVKTVTRISGDYNDSVNNLTCVAVRVANGSSTTSNRTIKIANVEAVVSIVDPSPMKSGGADGTTLGNYTITVNSNQRLEAAPTLVAPEGTLGTFSWSSTAKSFTATISVSDSDSKGVFSWGALLAQGLSGLDVIVATGEIGYEFKGIKTRTIALPAFGTVVTVNATLLPSSEPSTNVYWNFIQSSLSYHAIDELTPNSFTIINNTGTSFDIKILDAPRAASSSQESLLTIGV